MIMYRCKYLQRGTYHEKIVIFIAVVISALLCCGCVKDGPAFIKGEYIRTSTDAISSEGFTPHFIFLEMVIIFNVLVQ